jgi:hypothetical protein
MEWLLSPDALGRDFAPRMRDAMPRLHPWYEQHAPSLIPLVGRAIEAFARGLYLPRGSRTLIHGDLGLKNAAFIDESVVLFDWQLLGHHTPGMELTELVKDAFGPIGPKELTSRVLAVYHEALRAAGVRNYSLDELTEDFAQAVMRGITSPLMQLSIPNAGPANEAIALRWATLASSLAEEFDFERRLDSLLAQ